MANADLLLAKQMKRFGKSIDLLNNAPPQQPATRTVATVKIQREGPTRPWQENLPQYQTDNESNETASEQDLTTDGKSNRHNQTRQTDTNEHEKQTQLNTNRHDSSINQTQTDTKNTHKQTQDDFNSLLTEQNDLLPSISLPKNQESNEQETDTIKHKQTQNPIVSVLDKNCVPLQNDLCLLKEEIKQAQIDTVSVLEEARVPFEKDTTNRHKQTQSYQQTDTKLSSGKPKNELPTSLQQLQILKYLVEQQQLIGLGHTPKMKRKDVAAALGISPIGINNQLNRLLAGQYLIRLDSLRGRGDCGNIYQVPVTVIQKVKQIDTNRHKPLLKQTQQIDTNRHFKQTQLSPLSSSSYKTTTNYEEPLEEFQSACERFELEAIGVGSNDLSQGWKVWREKNYGELEKFLMSIEHVAFYLRSDSAKGIREPKAFFMKQLLRGFYPMPAGFIAWEVKQQEAVETALRARHEQLKAKRKEMRQLEFKNWLMELSSEKKSAIFKGLVAMSDTSPAASAMLRSAFLDEVGAEPWELP